MKHEIIKIPNGKIVEAEQSNSTAENTKPPDLFNNKVKDLCKQDRTLSKDEQEFEDIKFIKKNKTCAILGFAPSWNEAPFERKDVDFWGINELYIYLVQYKIETPFGAWFEIHDIKNSPSKQKPEHQKFLKNLKIPLVTQKHWDEYPSSIAYPRMYIKEKINEGFIFENKGAGFKDYSNQITWMIVLAIYLGYEEIHIYGVDMAQESEYSHQRASCQFAIGLARGKNIRLKIPASSQLLKGSSDYGFMSDNTNRFRLKSKIAQNEKMMQQLHYRLCELAHNIEILEKQILESEMRFKLDDEMIKKDIIETEKNIAICDNSKELISTLPDTLEEINTKKPILVSNIVNKANQYLGKLEGYKEELKKIEQNKLIKIRDLNVNIRILKEEMKKSEDDIIALRGVISADRHNINNNLI